MRTLELIGPPKRRSWVRLLIPRLASHEGYVEVVLPRIDEHYSWEG